MARSVMGKGVEMDQNKAYEWVSKAAANGHEKAIAMKKRFEEV